MSHDPAIDRAGLLALQQGDVTALNRLMARWQRPLFGFAYRYVQNVTDAHDLVAEVFVLLYQQRLRLRPDTNLSAWLFTTLTNLCHNHHRWKRRHPAVSLDAPVSDRADERLPRRSAADVPADQLGPDDLVAQDESLATVRGAIAQLPHDLRVTVLLHHYEHLSYREIAAIVGCSERGVETRLYRARQQLREALAEIIRESTAC